MPTDPKSTKITDDDSDIPSPSSSGSGQESETSELKRIEQWQQQKHDVRSWAFNLAIALAACVITLITVLATILYLQLMWSAPKEHLQHLWQFLTKFAMGAIAGGAAVIKIYRINIFPKNTPPPN